MVLYPPLSFSWTSPRRGASDPVLPLTQPPLVYSPSSSSSCSSIPQSHQDGVLSVPDFLAEVTQICVLIHALSDPIAGLAYLHQQNLTSVTETSCESVETNIYSQISIIRNKIKVLAIDAAKSRECVIKQSQIKVLQGTLGRKIDGYKDVQRQYAKRYREQMMRQVRIVMPDATEADVQEAVKWMDGGSSDIGRNNVFNMAFKQSYAQHTSSASILQFVRSRHTDISNMEKSLREVQGLFDDLAEAVAEQESAVIKMDMHTIDLNENIRGADLELGKAVVSARQTRRRKCIGLGLFILFIVLIIAAVVIVWKAGLIGGKTMAGI